MITVQTERCNGCGACVDTCPNGAILLQNGVAFISQDLCQECEACLDSCPESALVHQEQVQPAVEVVHMPSAPLAPLTSTQPVRIRERLWPAIGTFLVSAGSELVPRLAEIALNYLDQRVQAKEPRVKVERMPYRSGNPVKQKRGRRMRQRRHGRK